MKSLSFLIAALCLLMNSAEAETVKKSMSFSACLGFIQSMATQYGVAPVNIVETTDLRIVRFPTSDGSSLVTCSRPDNAATVMSTTNKCGVNVKC